MRSMFPEWYSPDENEISVLLKNGTIAFDANTLLDLYRVSDDQRKEIISVLRLVQDRIFIPYQVALEYQRGRLGEISAQQKAHQGLASIVEEAIGELLSYVNSKKKIIGEVISQLRDKDIKSELSTALEFGVDEISAQVETAKKLMLEQFEKVKSGHIVEFDVAKTADPVRDELDAILTSDRVGSMPDEAELKRRQVEGRRRVNDKVPPGYKDAAKDDPTGDYLVWQELLDFAKASDRNVLFVTNDEKEDWFLIAHGQKIGPRPELKKEMAVQANKTYHQTSLFGFLTLAKEHLDAPLSDATIESVFDVRVQANFEGVHTFEGRVVDIRVFVKTNGKLSYLVLVETDEGVRTITAENFSEIERSGIRIGDRVVCGKTRTGFEFIVGAILDGRTGREREFIPPTHCPECGSALVRRNDETHALKCPNIDYCPAHAQRLRS